MSVQGCQCYRLEKHTEAFHPPHNIPVQLLVTSILIIQNTFSTRAGINLTFQSLITWSQNINYDYCGKRTVKTKVSECICHISNLFVTELYSTSDLL